MRDNISKFIRENRRFVVTSHARPDGDSIGSELGLALALVSLGKSVQVFNADPTPHAYLALPGSEMLQLTGELEGDFDAVFVLECSDLSRTGIKNLERYYTISIDHHPNTPPFADLNWLDVSAAAVGELIFELIQSMSIRVTPEIATNLYVAILTDTGSFQYSNTTARTFEIAGRLVAAGANPGKIAQSVYMSQPHTKVLLLSKVLSTLTLHSSRRIAWIHLDSDMLRETGASADETEGMVNYPLSMEGVMMVAFFREQSQGVYRISLRSKDGFNVGSVAEQFGGGGHKNAAGLTVEGSLQDVQNRVVNELCRLLESDG